MGLENDNFQFKSDEILKKLESFLSSKTDDPAFQTEEVKELHYKLKLHNENLIKYQDKEVETELKSEELKNSSLVGFLAFDRDFVIQTANTAALKILHRKLKDLTGELFTKFVTAQYSKAFQSYHRKLLNIKKRQDQVLQLKRDGEKDLYVILESFPIVDEKEEIISIRAVIIDITEQKLADLRKQTELIQAAVEDMLDPFAILIAERDDTDKIVDFVYTYLNHAATKANKQSQEEIVGRSLLELSPSLRGSGIFNDLISAVETGRPVIKEGVYMEFEIEQQTIKGIFHTRINKLDDGVIITFRDITEKKAAEEKLKSAMASLEQSNKELEQFAYIASHDLQEPLRMVTQFTKLLSERYKGKSDPKTEEYVSIIIDGTDRMLILLKDLLKYARITSQSKPFAVTDFNKVVQDVLMDLKLLIEDNKVEVNVDPLPNLLADPVQMRQLFQNLIENAIKFRDSRKTVIKITAKPEEKEWIFSVEDNGIGIEQKYFERIFMIFQRLHERDKYSGSGIGLAICKQIVEHHGGRIWVESESERGSNFYFTLPKTPVNTY